MLRLIIKLVVFLLHVLSVSLFAEKLDPILNGFLPQSEIRQNEVVEIHGQKFETCRIPLDG